MQHMAREAPGDTGEAPGDTGSVLPQVRKTGQSQEDEANVCSREEVLDGMDQGQEPSVRRTAGGMTQNRGKQQPWAAGTKQGEPAAGGLEGEGGSVTGGGSLSTEVEEVEAGEGEVHEQPSRPPPRKRSRPSFSEDMRSGGRFSGRLPRKTDEVTLAAECEMLGPLVGGIGEHGESSRKTLASIVRSIASGAVRSYLEQREATITSLQQELQYLQQELQQACAAGSGGPGSAGQLPPLPLPLLQPAGGSSDAPKPATDAQDLEIWKDLARDQHQRILELKRKLAQAEDRAQRLEMEAHQAQAARMHWAGSGTQGGHQHRQQMAQEHAGMQRHGTHLVQRPSQDRVQELSLVHLAEDVRDRGDSGRAAHSQQQQYVQGVQHGYLADTAPAPISYVYAHAWPGQPGAHTAQPTDALQSNWAGQSQHGLATHTHEQHRWTPFSAAARPASSQQQQQQQQQQSNSGAATHMAVHQSPPHSINLHPHNGQAMGNGQRCVAQPYDDSPSQHWVQQGHQWKP